MPRNRSVALARSAPAADVFNPPVPGLAPVNPPFHGKGMHPYVKTLSEDALLPELDERMFDDGESEDLDTLLHSAKPFHGLTVSWG